MEIRLIDEIHRTGFKKLLEAIQEFRFVIFTIFNKRARKTIGDTESPVIFADQIKKEIIRRKIAFVCDLLKYLLIQVFIKIRGMNILSVPDVEDGKMIQSKRLMHLKVETYGWHIRLNPCRPEAFVLQHGPR